MTCPKKPDYFKTPAPIHSSLPPLSPSSNSLPPATTSSIQFRPPLIQDPSTASPSSAPPLPSFHNIDPMVTRSKVGITKPKALIASTPTEPYTFRRQDIKDPQWQLAMDVEYQALLRNNTWSLVHLPSHGNIIGCKWVFQY